MKKYQLKNNFTYFMKGTEKALKIMTCLFGAIIVSAVISIGAKANQTDWHDNGLSQQIQAETQCELIKVAYMKTAHVYRLILHWPQKKNCRLTLHKNKLKLTALGANNESGKLQNTNHPYRNRKIFWRIMGEQ
jgi:hypothetical protein